MQGAQLQEYELALEENAFPFEEKAIGVHEKNLELIRSGIYNAWIDKSLAKLVHLMPARYAKAEMSSGFLGSIDRYAYRSPSAPDTSPSAASAGAQERPPVATDIAAAIGPSGEPSVDTGVVSGGVANARAR
jgi:hypothetical protein